MGQLGLGHVPRLHGVYFEEEYYWREFGAMEKPTCEGCCMVEQVDLIISKPAIAQGQTILRRGL